MRSVGIRKHYDQTSWVSPPEEAARRLQAWRKGLTGYPIVDAGMRELYATGWMCQSVRMVVASFLVEYLRVNWVEGEKWFFDTLVDADRCVCVCMCVFVCVRVCVCECVCVCVCSQKQSDRQTCTAYHRHDHRAHLPLPLPLPK